MLNYKNTQSNFFEGYEKKDGLKKFHLMIPVELCIYAIRTKFIRPFQLYIFLKAISSGKIKLSALELKEIAKQFGLKSERAITNNLKLLKSIVMIFSNLKVSLIQIF